MLMQAQSPARVFLFLLPAARGAMREMCELFLHVVAMLIMYALWFIQFNTAREDLSWIGRLNCSSQDGIMFDYFNDRHLYSKVL